MAWEYGSNQIMCAKGIEYLMVNNGKYLNPSNTKIAIHFREA